MVKYGYIHIEVYSRQQSMLNAAGVGRELHEQFLASCNEKPPWSSTAFVCTVYKTKYLDDV